MVATARDFFNTGATKSLTYRKNQLSLLKKMLLEKKTQLLDALHADLKKPIEEALVTEFLLSMNEVDEALNNLEEWAKPYYPSKDLAFVLDTCLVRKEPKGKEILQDYIYLYLHMFRKGLLTHLLRIKITNNININ